MQALKRFVPLSKAHHDRTDFDCGKPELNTFIKRHALQNMKTKLSYTWVLPAAGIAKNEKKPICAYYTLSMCHIERQHLPENAAKRYPTYPLPVFMLARLAVDKRCQGQKLGTSTLINALRRCTQLSQGGKVASIAVILDVLDNDAMQFYQRFPDFQELQTAHDNDSLPRLFIPMKVIEHI